MAGPGQLYRGPSAGVGVAERDVRAEAAGTLQQHDVSGVLARRAVYSDGWRRRKGNNVR